MPDSMPEWMSEYYAKQIQKVCQIICQRECKVECQKYAIYTSKWRVKNSVGSQSGDQLKKVDYLGIFLSTTRNYPIFFPEKYLTCFCSSGLSPQFFHNRRPWRPFQGPNGSPPSHAPWDVSASSRRATFRRWSRRDRWRCHIALQAADGGEES